MVNPLKHANKLNKDDIRNIYNRLNKQYKLSRDYNTKKELNQQILVLLLLCRNFPVQDLVKIDFDFFDPEPKDTIFYKHLQEHLMNNFCEIDGLLLTNRNNKALKQEDIEKLIEKIDTGLTNKKLTVEALNIINHEFEDFGKTFNKKRVKKHIELKNELRSMKENLKENIKKVNTIDKEDITKITQEIKDEVITQVEDKFSKKDNNDELLDVLIEKQDILEDAVNNKYNKLSNTLNKIHQNTKAQNSKYNKLIENFNQLPLIKDDITTSITKQNDTLNELEDKIDEIRCQLDEIRRDDTMIVDDSNTQQALLIEKPDKYNIDFSQMEEFMLNWYSRNLKVTRKPTDAVDMNEIIQKLEKHLEIHELNIDRKLLYDRMESYLSVWFNNQNTRQKFKEIRTETIKDTIMYTNLKFIDHNEEHENRIKNTLIAWLKDNTCEESGSKTYTKDIYEKTAPLFEENGWSIVKSDEYKSLVAAGFTKVCETRNFSQIIGKAVLNVYPDIQTKRDVPNNTGNVTWYSGLHIIDKELSASTRNIIENELTVDHDEHDNIIYKYLDQELTFTGSSDDKTSKEVLFNGLTEHLKHEDLNVNSEELYFLFNNTLNVICSEHKVVNNKNSEFVRQFVIEEEYVANIDDIIESWIDTYIVDDGNKNDKAYLYDINEKITVNMLGENISIVSDEVYEQLPFTLRKQFITKTQYDETLSKALKAKISKHILTDKAGEKYYPGLKVVRYYTLKEENIKEWVASNIDELLSTNIVSKAKIVGEFTSYLEESNIRNKTEHSLGVLLDAATREYYDQKSVTFNILNGDKEEYYALIA